ncbi:MAG: dienelactone hydrolase family protein [Candidatus Obscuribacterales bacterium]|nr:dienelactone hydrolase family protein [Steroidobacteraceae bacterium]
MSYRKNELTDGVILEPPAPPSATVIWLHGLGADGHDFVPIVPEFRLPNTLNIRFVFPHARLRPVTINNGYVMRAWYDIKLTTLNRTSNKIDEDEPGIREAENVVRNYIQRERDAGIAANRIVIAGFSQGGAIALQTALRYPQRLAGVLALSTYLPLSGALAGEVAKVNCDVPILMCHGRQDTVLPLQLGEQSRDVLRTQGYQVDWREYPMAHEVCVPEIANISAWLLKHLET